METRFNEGDLLTVFTSAYELGEDQPASKMPELSFWTPVAIASFVTSLEALRKGRWGLATLALGLTFAASLKECLHQDALKRAQIGHSQPHQTSELAFRLNVAARTLLLPK